MVCVITDGATSLSQRSGTFFLRLPPCRFGADADTDRRAVHDTSYRYQLPLHQLPLPGGKSPPSIA